MGLSKTVKNNINMIYVSLFKMNIHDIFLNPYQKHVYAIMVPNKLFPDTLNHCGINCFKGSVLSPISNNNVFVNKQNSSDTLYGSHNQTLRLKISLALK